mgnify:CR=1 FL=1
MDLTTEFLQKKIDNELMSATVDEMTAEGSGEALMRLDGDAAVDISRALAHPDTSVAAAAAFALGQIADSAAVPLLLPYADAARAATSPTVVAEVAYALGKTRHPQARAALENLLRTVPQSGGEGNGIVAGAALLAVWRQGRPLPVSAIDPWIRHADPELRWRAAYALARRSEPAAAAILFRAAGDGEPLVRSFVARALTGPMADSSGVGRQAAQDAVIRMATADPEMIVRVNALRTLGTYPGEPAMRALIQTAATDREPYAVIAALEEAVRRGEFRADLLYRLEVMRIALPVAFFTFGLGSFLLFGAGVLAGGALLPAPASALDWSSGW